MVRSSSRLLAGLSVLTAVAAVAGGYFLYGTKEGPKRRKLIKGWMVKFKGEVLEQIEQARDLNQQTYDQIVDRVAEQYTKIKDIRAEDVAKIVTELKKYWKPLVHTADKKVRPKKKSKKPRSTKTAASPQR